jgi:UDPglucose 6-dehydrogenase
MPVASFHLKTYEACQNAHAIAVLTEWDEFATMIGRKYTIDAKPAFIF